MFHVLIVILCILWQKSFTIPLFTIHILDYVFSRVRLTSHTYSIGHVCLRTFLVILKIVLNFKKRFINIIVPLLLYHLGSMWIEQLFKVLGHPIFAFMVLFTILWDLFCQLKSRNHPMPSSTFMILRKQQIGIYDKIQNSVALFFWICILCLETLIPMLLFTSRLMK